MQTIGYVVVSESGAESGRYRPAAPANRAAFEVESDIFRVFNDAETVATAMCVQNPDSRYRVGTIAIED